jgi:hypothetical protein
MGTLCAELWAGRRRLAHGGWANGARLLRAWLVEQDLHGTAARSACSSQFNLCVLECMHVTLFLQAMNLSRFEMDRWMERWTLVVSASVARPLHCCAVLTV